MHCDIVTYCVIRISNNVKYLNKEESYKNSMKKSHIVNLSDLCKATKNILDKNMWRLYLCKRPTRGLPDGHLGQFASG